MSITIERLDVPHLKKSALALGLRVGTKIPKEELAQSVAIGLEKKYPHALMMNCSECGFPSPETEDLPRCPGCGVKFDSDDEEDAEDDDHGEEEQATEMASNEKPNGKANGKSNGKSAHEELALVEKDQVKEPEVILPQSAAAATRELGERTKRILTLRNDIAKNAWEIGKEFSAIRNQDLWRQKYTSLADYAEKVCGFTMRTVQSFMRISERFSPTQLEGIPVSHLRLLAEYPGDSEEREQLTKEVREKKPSRPELAEKVREKRAEKTGEKIEKTILVSANLAPGEIFVGKWSSYAAGIGRGRFKIGDASFVLEVKKGQGFRIILKK